MFEVLIPSMAIALVAFAAFAWVFLILLIISKLTKKDILEEAKPYKMFFCTGLLTIVALIINAGSGLRGIVGLTSFLDIISNPFLEMLITTATQLVLSYIILLKFQFRKKEAALCAIVISILFNYYLIVFVAQNYTILIDKIFFPTVQSRYIPPLGNIGATNFQDDSYRALESLIIIVPVFIAVLALFLKLSTHQIKDWNPINSKKFKEKLYLFAGIFIILILIFGYLGINTYNEQKQYYEDLITAEKEAEQNAPIAFELISENLVKAITQGYYEIDRTRVKGGAYEVTSQELAIKSRIVKDSIVFIVPEKYKDIFQTDGTNLIGSKEKNFIATAISCKETIELAASEIYQESNNYYDIDPPYTNACNDLNYCCLIAVKPY